MKYIRFIPILVLLLVGEALCLAQPDRSQVRAGNRQFRRSEWKLADISYRKALVADSTSLAANYDLASNLYRQENMEEAGKYLDAVKEKAVSSPHASDWWYNKGDVALQKKDYQGAVDAFKQSLLKNPGDLDAKENYLYAKKMLENQQQNQDQNQDNKDQNQDQDNQDQNQDQQDQDQNQDQNQDQQDQQDQDNRQNLSKEQVQQLLQAIQAKEKETQDKVNKEKAAALKSREKEKNW